MQNVDWKNQRVAPRYRFWGLGSRSNNMGADVGGRSIHAKEHFCSKASWIRKNFDLPRIEQSYWEKALVVIPPVMKICATSNGEQRVQVLITVVQGLTQKQRQLMQQYFELVDWKGLKLLSAERRQRDSLKSFERSEEVWKDWIHLDKELATLGEELPPVELLPARSKKQSPDPTKRGTSREEFGRRLLAWGNMWDSLSCLLTLLESLDKNNLEMGIDSVARQMHQKTVQHYWVNIVKQQVKGGGRPTLGDTLIPPMEAALNETTFLTQEKALLGKAIGEHITQQNADVKIIFNKDRQVAPKRMPLGACLAVNTHNMEGRFVESVKNSRWLMSLQETGVGLESIIEFQVQIKGHNQPEYDRV